MCAGAGGDGVWVVCSSIDLHITSTNVKTMKDHLKFGLDVETNETLPPTHTPPTSRSQEMVHYFQNQGFWREQDKPLNQLWTDFWNQGTESGLGFYHGGQVGPKWEFSHVVTSIHGSDLPVVLKEGAPRLSSQFTQISHIRGRGRASWKMKGQILPMIRDRSVTLPCTAGALGNGGP